VNSDRLPSLAMQALPPDAGSMVQCSPGEWFPNVRGFNDVRSNPFAPVNRQAGVVVLTSDALYFEQWDAREKAYEVVKRIPVSVIRRVSVDAEGASRRVVIQNKDLGYDSFGLTQAGGLVTDKSETESLVERLTRLLK
jgi:hypothetical protein